MTTTIGEGAALDVGEQLQALRPRDNASWRERVGPFVVLGAFIGLWYLLSEWAMENLFHKPKFLVPPPHRVLIDSFTDGRFRSEMFRGLYLSAKVAFLGLSIAIVLGIGLAVLMSRARWIEKSLFPYIVTVQAIPILAFVPLIGSLFDFSFTSRVIVCVIISLFPIVANTLFGLLSADAGQHDLFTLHGATSFERLWKLQFPGALPSIFTGFRISAGLSIIGAVVGDFFFRQGEAGIGQLIDKYRSRIQTEQMYGAVLLTSALSILVFWFFGYLSRRVVGRWHEVTGQS